MVLPGFGSALLPPALKAILATACSYLAGLTCCLPSQALESLREWAVRRKFLKHMSKVLPCVPGDPEESECW